jgi:cytolysin-activating lysine-acyltransferase
MNDGFKIGKPMSDIRFAPRQKSNENQIPKPIDARAAWAPIYKPAPRAHLDDIFAPMPEKRVAPITADSFRNLKAFAPLPKTELREIVAAQIPPAPVAPITKNVRAPIPVAMPTPLRRPPMPMAPVRAAAPALAAQAVQAPANDVKAMGSKLNENFGAFVLALAETARYRHIGLGELISQFYEPMQRDRVAIALSGANEEEARSGKPSAFMIWASVSPEVDEKIREQVSAGVFPLRLKPEDWASGSINWLLDVVAATPQMRSVAMSSFVQSKRLGELRLHPIVNRLVDAEQLEKMGLSHRAEGDRKTA